MTGTGEEWRAMDEASRHYDPTAFSAQLARARAGIEAHRKRDVVLTVVDRQGRPVPRLPVEVTQLRSAFPFGEQTWDIARQRRFAQDEHDRARYQRLRFAELFNAANALCYWTERPRNDGSKSEDLQGDQRLDDFAWTVDWARSQGLLVKGHPLFWSIPKAVPDWVMRYDAETRMRFLEVRVRSLVARFRGRIAIWDAINEPMWEPAFRNLEHRHWPHLEAIDAIADYVAPVLRWCREEDPDATFLVNDYGMEADPPGGAPRAADGTAATIRLQRQRYLALMRALHERGTPPDGIGLQSHTGGWLPHDEQWALYDEMATSGLPVHITEFWADTRHLEKAGVERAAAEQLQADYIVNYLTCAFGHPAVDAFFFWGFAGVRWLEHSGHELTPLYHRVRRLLHEEWRTRVQLVTGDDGSVRFRGFLGDYALRYRSAQHQHGAPFTVARGGGALTVAAPFAPR